MKPPPHFRWCLAFLVAACVAGQVGVVSAVQPSANEPGGQQGPRNPIARVLGADDDGRTFAAEMADAATASKRLDLYGNGRLVRDEMRPADPPLGRPDDANRRSERQQPPASGLDVRPRRDDFPRRHGRYRPSADTRAEAGRDQRRPGRDPHGESADWPTPEQLQTPPPRLPAWLKNLPPAPIDGFVTIPAGQFEMGDHHNLGGMEHGNDEVPVHTVRVDGFFMAATETTNRQYADFLNAAMAAGSVAVRHGVVCGTSNHSVYFETYQADPASGISFDGRGFVVRDGRAEHPVVCVRWLGAAAYCNWLSARAGYEPCYNLATGACDFSKEGFRLPTEAEWEYAGRAGLYGPYYIWPWGNEPDSRRANWPESGDPFESGPFPHTTPVGFYDGSLRRKEPYGWPGQTATYQTHDGRNGYGLYDMAGNAWEWTNDWYDHRYYAVSPSENPRGPERGQPMRDGKPYHVLRGGSWYNGRYGHSRVSNRNPACFRGPDDPNHRWYAVGFRVVLAPKGSRVPVVPAALPTAPSQGVKRPESDGTYSAPGPSPDAKRTVGLMLNTAKACPGYTLFAPKHNTTIYLIDNDGRVVHRWKSEYEPGQSVYLLPNGHLLHCCFTHAQGFTRGGEGGRLEEFDWEGNLVWAFDFATDRYLSHHDWVRIFNKKINAFTTLYIANRSVSREQAIAAGCDPERGLPRDASVDAIVEVDMNGNVVWEWWFLDHTIQDDNPNWPNWAGPGKTGADYPGRIDVNMPGHPLKRDWLHCNSLDYNAERGHIVVNSVHGEFYIIDHDGTFVAGDPRRSIELAAGSAGDFLYRFGDPARCGQGDPPRILENWNVATSGHKQIGGSHHVHWIRPSLPGAGHILIFNNGQYLFDRTSQSSVLEINPFLDAGGQGSSHYVNPPEAGYTLVEFHHDTHKPKRLLSKQVVWSCQSKSNQGFFSHIGSGAQRLPNGNTLVCAMTEGHFFEVTADGELVWEYINPITPDGPVKVLKDSLPMTNAVFRACRYAPDHPALRGRDLTPKGTITARWASGLDRDLLRPRRTPDNHTPSRGGRRRGSPPPPRRSH